MENLSSCVIDPPKDTNPVTPLNTRGSLTDEALLINESQVTFYSTPATQSFASSCISSRSVKEASIQNNLCVSYEEEKQAEKVVQRLSFTVSDSQQVGVTADNVPVETKKESRGLVGTSSCNSQSFTVTKDGKGLSEGANEHPAASNTIRASSCTMLCSPLGTDTVKETLCNNLESTFTTTQGVGDIVPSQNALNVTMDTGIKPLANVATVHPMQNHRDQGDSWLISSNTSQTHQEAEPLEQGDCCGINMTYQKEHVEKEVSLSKKNTSSITEPAIPDKNDFEKAAHHADGHAKEPGLTLGRMNATFQRSEAVKAGPNTTLDGAESHEVCNRTVNIETKENTRKSPPPCSTVQNKKPSQLMDVAVKKAPTRPSLLPRVTTQRRTIIRRPGPATAGQGDLQRQTTSQPLKATFDDQAGQTALSSKGKVPSRETLVRQPRAPLQSTHLTNNASKPLRGNQPVVSSIRGPKKEHVAKQPLNETIVADVTGRRTGVKPSAVPVARGISKAYPVREAQNSTAAVSAPTLGSNRKAAQLQTSGTRLQRPKIGLGHSQIRKQTPTQPAQAKRNLASTPVRNDAVPLIGHAGLPTPIKKC